MPKIAALVLIDEDRSVMEQLVHGTFITRLSSSFAFDPDNVTDGMVYCTRLWTNPEFNDVFDALPVDEQNTVLEQTLMQLDDRTFLSRDLDLPTALRLSEEQGAPPRTVMDFDAALTAWFKDPPID